MQDAEYEICIWPTFLFPFQKKALAREGKHNLHTKTIIAKTGHFE